MQTYFGGRLLSAESFDSEQAYVTPHPSPTGEPHESLSEAVRSSLPSGILDAVASDLQASPLNVPTGWITGSPNVAVVETPATGARAADSVIEADLLNRAQQAGLDSDELSRLKQILDTSADFKADASLLKQILPDEADPYLPNSDRALRTFMDLDEQRRTHPDRITPDIVTTLVTGVARSRAEFGLEGVLGENTADRAAQALIEMPQADYDAIQGVLKQAGHGGDVVFSDAETERDLILKAVAAREQAYSHPSVIDRVVKPTMIETRDIVDFANTIRGKDRDDLLFRTSVASGADNDVLRQRYFDSCAPTTVEMLKAEADPIYAWKLHGEDVNGWGPGGFIGQEQAQMMKADGAMIITFEMAQQLQQLADSGNPVLAAMAKKMLEQGDRHLEDQANAFASSTTGRDYHTTRVNDDVASRTAAADYIEKLAREGVDVPIGVEWTARNWMNPMSSVDTGTGHALLITDVRGHGNDAVFVISDPATGSTYQVSRSDLISGNTQFGDDAKGRILEFLW